MNYLAHAYLSFKQPEVLVGNIIADFMRGRVPPDLPDGIRAGIALHRAIDTFTDAHPATLGAKTFFQPVYRLYAAPVVDIVFDHLLATDASVFSPRTLHEFTQWTYNTLGAAEQWHPERFAQAFPYMRSYNWLYNYKEEWGLGRSLTGLVRRASQMPPADEALAIVRRHRPALDACYRRLMPDLEQFAQQELKRILT